jgi:hypothetical protein
MSYLFMDCHFIKTVRSIETKQPRQIMKNFIEFKLDTGEIAYMQIEETEEQTQARQRVSRGSGGCN